MSALFCHIFMLGVLTKPHPKQGTQALPPMFHLPSDLWVALHGGLMIARSETFSFHIGLIPV